MKKFLTKYGVTISLSIILIASIFERFAYLESRPNWYVDEGSNVIIAWNLMHGHAAFQGLEQTFIPHFPLFFILGGIFTLIFGKTILALRIFAVTCTIISTFILYFIGKELKSKWIGVAMAATFCLMSDTLLKSRYGTSSNLATLEISLFVLFLLKYSQTKLEKWLYASAVVSAFLVFTDYFLWGILIVYPILLWKKQMKLFLKIMAISFSLVGIFAVIMLITRSHWFLEDIQYYFISRPTFSALNQGIENQVGIFSNLLLIISKWLGNSMFIAIGLIGFLFIPIKRHRLIIVTCFLAIMAPLFLYGQPSFADRNQIMLEPFIAIGVVFSVLKIYKLFEKAFFENSRLKLALPILFIFCTIMIFRFDARFIITFYYKNPPMQIFKSNYTDHADIKSIANYINERSTKEDYIIAQDNVAFLINAKTSDTFTATAYAGNYTETTSPDFLSRERFTFDHTPEKARYYIADATIIKYWIIEHPSMKELLENLEKWPIVYSAGKFVVRQNPLILNN